MQLQQHLWKAALFSSLLSAAQISAASDASHEGNHPRFDQLDQNNNGTLSLEEFKQRDMPPHVREKRQAYIFAKIDRNQDGEISPEEMKAHAPRHKKKGKGFRRQQGMENAASSSQES